MKIGLLTSETDSESTYWAELTHAVQVTLIIDQTIVQYAYSCIVAQSDRRYRTWVWLYTIMAQSDPRGARRGARAAARIMRN